MNTGIGIRNVAPKKRGLPGLHASVQSIVGKRLDEIARLPGVEYVIIFGSYAKGTYDAASDLDVAVFFRETGGSMLEKFRILQKICSCPEIDIQVQAFGVDELRDPCGIIQEIVMYGLEYAPVYGRSLPVA